MVIFPIIFFWGGGVPPVSYAYVMMMAMMMKVIKSNLVEITNDWIGLSRV